MDMELVGVDFDFFLSTLKTSLGGLIYPALILSFAVLMVKTFSRWLRRAAVARTGVRVSGVALNRRMRAIRILERGSRRRR